MASSTDEWLCGDDELEDLDTAARVLAKRLQRGELTLVIGAGASKGLGLPSWWELVRDCCIRSGVASSVDATSSFASLESVMAEVRKTLATTGSSTNNEAYLRIVREALYANFTPSSWLTDVNVALLRAIGALTMGSRFGTVTDLMTYNYDDLIEQYMRYHGSVAQSIIYQPELASDSDVRIYHLHGFLPYKGDNFSQDIILDRRSYTTRIAGLDDWDRLWTQQMVNLLLNKQAIFIGISGTDPLLRQALPQVKKFIGKRNENGRRKVGYWLTGTPLAKDTEDLIKDDFGCTVLHLGSHDQIPEFLLEIRRVCIGEV